MSNNPYRNALAELHVAIQLYTGLNPAAAGAGPAELVCRLMEAMAASAALLAQPKPPELTDAYLISAHDLAAGWNQQADAYNQWDSLDLYEQLAWAQSRAIVADRARPEPIPATHLPHFC
jgi:hypothetical protein